MENKWGREDLFCEYCSYPHSNPGWTHIGVVPQAPVLVLSGYFTASKLDYGPVKLETAR